MIKGFWAIAIALLIVLVAWAIETFRDSHPALFARYYRMALVSTLVAGLIVLAAWHFCGV